MDQLILEPLKYYNDYAKERHKENLNARFDELVSESKIDVEANRATVKRYDDEMAKVLREDSRLRKYKLGFGLLITLGIIGIITLIVGIYYTGKAPTLGIGLISGGGVSIFVGFFIAFRVIRRRMREIEKTKAVYAARAAEIKAEAEAQMAPLNRLFSGLDTLKIIEKTMPEVKFDVTYGCSRERELIDKYDYIDMTDEDTSVTDMLSGTLFGNPFLFERYKSFGMGMHTYVGTKTIFWTETYRDSNGNLRQRTRSQVLTATLVKPKPMYHVSTHLGYGSQAAPDLSFSRTESDSDELSEKALAKRIKAGEKKLRRHAEKSAKGGGDFQEMANSEFEVLFGAKNRDHEVQFRLMYTPLAQNNTTDLLRSKDGYGDDFNFIKQGRFNIIKSIHAQGWNMDLSPMRYRSHSVDLSREAYLSFNENYFKSVFFDFAPLMAVPAYQAPPVDSMEKPTENYFSNFTSYEHEALANAIGERVFAHERTATDAILKTSLISSSAGEDRVAVTAYSFAAENRLDFVPTLGGDRRMHLVPVPWIEYIPIKRASEMIVKTAEDCDDFKNYEFTSLHGLIARAAGKTR